MSVHFHDSLLPLMTDIDSVHQHPDNPNDGDVELIVQLILANGFYAPIVAQESTGRIIVGNHRYAALLALEQKQAPVLWLDVDDDEAHAIMLGDNRASEMSQRNPHALKSILVNLQNKGKLPGTGYNDDQVKDLIRRIQATDHMPIDPSRDNHGGKVVPRVIVDGFLEEDGSFQPFTFDDLPDAILRLRDFGYRARGTHD